jgi:hypothetical protein
MSAYPEPDQVTFLLNCQRSMIQPDPYRPIALNFLQVQRRMPGIGFQEFEVFIRELPYFLRQSAAEPPK